MTPIYEKQISETEYCSKSSCNSWVNWNAILVPALLAIGLSFLVNIFTAGLGLSAYTNNPEGQVTIMVSGFIWLFLIFYFIMFLMGYISGVMTQPFRCAGVLHAFAAWSLALLINVALFSQTAANALGTPTYYSYKTVANTQTQVQPNNNQVVTQDTTNKMGIGVLGIFFIFLAGALGSCTGGYVGSRQTNDVVRKSEL